MKAAARRRMRRAAPVAGLVVLAAVLALVGGLGGDEGRPLDPASPGPAGTKALVDVLAELGVDVAVEERLSPAGPDAMLLLADNLDDETRAGLESYVRDGGTLVVTDPFSPFAPEPVGTTTFGLLDVTLSRDCDVAALAGADRVSAPGSFVFATPDDATGCYGRGEGHWLVIRSEGRGTVVAVGGPSFLTNAVLDEAGNAVLAVSLLAPSRQASVTILSPDFAIAGDKGAATLGDLVPRRVRLALLQLLVAFGVVVLWRSRRLGRPVAEPQPVELPASELVVAVANLLQRTGSQRRAADLLRADLQRDLSERLGLAPGASPADVAGAAARRAGVPADEALAVLRDQNLQSDADLVALARRVEDLRSTVAHATGASVVG